MTLASAARSNGVPPFRDLQVVRAELSRARLICRAWAETVPEARRKDESAVFTRHALEALGRQRAPAAVPCEPFAKPYSWPNHATKQLAETIGFLAARLPITEALHVVTSLYPALLPADERGMLGAFYTPPALCARLLEQAVEAGIDWRTAKVLDPATGGGAFLIHVAIRMREAMSDCPAAMILSQLSGRLVGFELDPNAASLAQMAIDILFSDLAEAADRPVPVVVKVADTLEELPDEAFDLVVGNPPYGRITLTRAQRQRYSRSLYGHANLYGVFTDIALRWTKAGGLIAYLTPASFLAGQYYAALRDLLACEAPPVCIDFVHARRGIFEDALQETLLAVYRKSGSVVRAQIRYLHVSSECEAKVITNGTVGLPPDPKNPWLAPRDPEHSALIRQAEAMKFRLSDWGYSVSTGPLVWNRFKSQLRHEKRSKTVHPLIWAEAVTADGRFIFRAQKRNHAPYFKLEKDDGWLLVEEPCVLVQRTTAKEQSRRLIAAELPAQFVEENNGVVVENHLNMVRADGRPKVPASVVAALLNSRVVDEIFRCMNGSVAVSAFELEALPMPEIGRLKTLKRLVKNGADRLLIEAECARLYGEEKS